MEYEPGTCNIGEGERKKRAYIGMIGFIAGSAVLTGILYLDLPPISVVALFISFMIGFEGYFQTRSSFCAGFAMKGVYDTSEEGDQRQTVEAEEAHRKDVKKAVKIHLSSIISALFTSAIAYSMLFGG